MTAIFGNSAVAVAVVARTRPRALPTAMITMKTSTRGFSFLSYSRMAFGLTAFRAAGTTLKSDNNSFGEEGEGVG